MSQCPSEEIASLIASCGLYCGGCFAYKNSPIRRAAADLQRSLGPNFPSYAERFVAVNPVFEDYPAFRRLLSYLASGPCEGCRGKGCDERECTVWRCAKERGVGHCYKCADFPCANPGIPQDIKDVWLLNNKRIREVGFEAYCREVCNKNCYS